MEKDTAMHTSIEAATLADNVCKQRGRQTDKKRKSACVNKSDAA